MAHPIAECRSLLPPVRRGQFIVEVGVLGLNKLPVVDEVLSVEKVEDVVVLGKRLDRLEWK